MRTHRLMAAVLLMGMGALGAPPAQADEGPSATPEITAAATTPSSSATLTDPRPRAKPAPMATPTRLPARSPGPMTNPTSASVAASTASAPSAAADSDPSASRSASIGAFDCAALSVPVTLDNTRSSTATTFVLTTLVLAGPTLRTEEVVPAGTTSKTRVDLVDNAYNEVVVAVVDETVAASARPVFCGEKPRVTIGAFDCSTLQAPVTLDNRTGATPFLFSVQWYFSNTDFERNESYTVEAGAVRVVMVPLVDNAWTAIWVREGFDVPPTPLDQFVVTTRGLCGLEPGPARVTVGGVDCATKTIGVTIDTRQTPPRRPRTTTIYIATSYGGKQDYVRYVEGEDVYRLTVPVRLRTGGRLTVTGAGPSGAAPREVLYSGPLDTTCNAPTPSTTAGPAGQQGQPATPAAAEQLPATGGTALPALFLAAGLVTSGVVLIRLGTRRREH